MEFFTHPPTVAFLFVAPLVATNVATLWATARLTREQQKQWPAIASIVVVGVISTVIAVPTINHLWAEYRDEKNEQRARQRDLENQRQKVRDQHLERLRPVLLSDTLRERYKRLAAELRTLSTEAAIAAESATLLGECSYVPRLAV
jgi:hypothetical protein